MTARIALSAAALAAALAAGGCETAPPEENSPAEQQGRARPRPGDEPKTAPAAKGKAPAGVAPPGAD